MKSRQSKRALVGALVLTLLAAWSVTAALDANSRHVTLGNGVTLHGQTIPAGDYKLQWTPNGGDGAFDVVIQRGKNVVARAAGKRYEQSTASKYDSVVSKPSDNGAEELSEIRFAGSKEAIRLGPATVASN